MYTPTTRLFTLLELLQAAPQVSGRELAAQLGVDVRTVRHYVTILQDAGIPIVSTTGRAGGYRLRPGFKLPPLMFSDDEAGAVTLGLLLVRQTGLAHAEVAATTALAKIQRVLPVARREQVEALQSVVALDVTLGEARVEQTVLRVLTVAAQQSRQVQLRYTKKVGYMSERVLNPYAVIYHQERWYVVGYCELRRAVRSFRLDRIVQAILLESTFERPEHFNGLTYLLGAIAAIPDVWNVDVTLAMQLEDAQKCVPATLAHLEAEGTMVRLRASIGNLDWMARFLIHLGCSFTIHEPIELRHTLQNIATELLQIANIGTV